MTNSDSVLLESAMQTLRMIAQAHVFKDQDGDKMILAKWQDLAIKEVALIEFKLKVRAASEIEEKSEEADEELDEREDYAPDPNWTDPNWRTGPLFQ